MKTSLVSTLADDILDAPNFRRMPKRIWPDDCPTCGARMEFGFTEVRGESVAHRECKCGRVVMLKEVLAA